jgi:transcriptional regulator with XRE-family HTH domain
MKDIDWTLLVNDIQEYNFLSQTALSDMLNVSQQSISNWQNGSRNPRAETKMRLLEIATENGIDVNKYKMNPEIRAIRKHADTRKGKEFIRIFEQYTRMSQSNKKKFVDCAEKLARRDARSKDISAK